jgi:cytochrome c-type biogenesis protein
MVKDQIFISTIFVAGILSFFAPCVVPLLPVYFSMFLGDQKSKIEDKYIIKLGLFEINLIIVAKTIVFVTGISTSFLILGFGAGSLGTIINSKVFIWICGLIVIILGIHQTGLLHFNLLYREKKLNISSKKSVLGTYLLGFSFSFGWTPCIGPLLAAVLGISVTRGQAFYGLWLMFIYSLGLMLPFLIVSVFSSVLLNRIRVLNKHLEKIKIAGGIVIIFMGLLLMNNNVNFVTKLFIK